MATSVIDFKVLEYKGCGATDKWAELRILDI
jgi:hypothetical protein